MKGTLYIIPADNVEPMTVRELTAAPDLDTLQKAVEGSIETVPLFELFRGVPAVAFCNEEGKVNGMHLNERATKLWDEAIAPEPRFDVLVGDVVVITGDAELMASL